jgi:hypothetical protein
MGRVLEHQYASTMPVCVVQTPCKHLSDTAISTCSFFHSFFIFYLFYFVKKIGKCWHICRWGFPKLCLSPKVMCLAPRYENGCKTMGTKYCKNLKFCIRKFPNLFRGFPGFCGLSRLETLKTVSFGVFHQPFLGRFPQFSGSSGFIRFG